MTPEEKIAFNKMEHDIQGLVHTQNENGYKLDEIIKAIKGDDMGNTGIVERIKANEADIKELKNARAIDKAYAKIAIWLLATIAGGVLAAVIKLIF